MSEEAEGALDAELSEMVSDWDPEVSEVLAMAEDLKPQLKALEMSWLQASDEERRAAEPAIRAVFGALSLARYWCHKLAQLNLTDGEGG